MRDLGVLGGSVRFPAASGINAVAYGINSSGQIVGQSTYNGAPDYTDTHAFLTTTAGGPMTDLGTLGGSFSAAFGINTLGQAVGSATTTGDAALHAFIYSGGVMNDLNASLPSGTPWLIQSASSINDNGQIVASAELNDNTQHAVRVDPADVSTSILINLLSSPSLNLTSGQVSSLTDKLNNAIASIQSGLYKQATNQLNSFIGAVQTQVKVGKLSSSAGTQLVTAANVIIAAIS